MHQITDAEFALLQAAKKLSTIFGFHENDLVTHRSTPRTEAEAALLEVVRLSYKCQKPVPTGDKI